MRLHFRKRSKSDRPGFARFPQVALFLSCSSRVTRAAMSTKHVRTAADLVRFETALKIECTSCGNSRTLSGFDVVKLCGTQDLRSLQHRFKCSRCGAREASLTVLSPPPKLGSLVVLVLADRCEPLRESLRDLVFGSEVLAPDCAAFG